MGKPLLGLILINRIRASHGSCNHPDGLSPRKRKSAESVIIGINKSVKSAQSVVLLLASVFCLRQTQVFTSEPNISFIFVRFGTICMISREAIPYTELTLQSLHTRLCEHISTIPCGIRQTHLFWLHIIICLVYYFSFGLNTPICIQAKLSFVFKPNWKL